MSYTMEILEHGVIVRGTVPISQTGKIGEMAKCLGFDIIDPGLHGPLQALMVITNAEGSEFFRAEITEQLKGKSKEDQWIKGVDTGISSKTIFFTMTGRPTLDSPYHPCDASDFGRCYRLLKLFPEWIPRLPEVSEKYPSWSGLVKNWPELTAIYEEELPTGKCPKLYARMQKLLK